MTKEKSTEAPTGLLPYDQLKDSMGRFRTQSLFVEHAHPDYISPYTLKDREHKGRISMYLKYMEYSDPTEYSFAIACLGSWKHWVQLSEADWFKPFIDQWRSELKQKLAYERFKEMADAATKKGNLQATKWLDEKYGLKPASKRGRPTKAEKVAHLKAVKEESDLVSEEATRLGLVK
jgi:hypothetical protein